MRIAKIEDVSLSNGPGVRVCLYTQGCPFHCKNCFNPETWDYMGGEDWDKDKHDTLFDYCDHNYIKGLSVLGGEPLIYQNIFDLAKVLTEFKEKFPDKSVWIWTGYTWEDLQERYKGNSSFQQLLSQTDVMIDGPFIEALKDPSLKWKGSSNQRTIDVKATLQENQIVLYE